MRPTGQIATDITRSLSLAPSPQRWLTPRNKRFRVIELAHFEDSSIRNFPIVIIVQLGLYRSVQQHIEYLACIECDFHIPFNSDKLLISKFNADVLQTVLSGHSSSCTKPSLYHSQHYSLTASGEIDAQQNFKITLNKLGGLCAEWQDFLRTPIITAKYFQQAVAQASSSSSERGLLAELNEFMIPTEPFPHVLYSSFVEPRNCILYYFFIQVFLHLKYLTLAYLGLGRFLG